MCDRGLGIGGLSGNEGGKLTADYPAQRKGWRFTGLLASYFYEALLYVWLEVDEVVKCLPPGTETLKDGLPTGI
jgi:hypothetical protein